MTTPDQQLRVLQVITRSDAIGGAHTHVASLGRALRERGHDVLVAVGPPETGPFPHLLDSLEVPWVSVPSLVRAVRPASDARAFREICALIAGRQPDVIHCHSSKAGVLTRWAARRAGVPCVFTAHGWSFAEGVPRRSAAVWRQVERVTGRGAGAHVIAVSHADAAMAQAARVVPADRLHVVHNGIREVPDSLCAVPEARPATITMVARFDEQKDHPTLIRALEQLADLPWDLKLVGDGPLTAQARALVNSAGLASVEFMGLRDDVTEILARSQCLVLSTNWEGLPISILEAMRAGLPCIATDVGGVRELIQDGVTGYLVPRADPGLLAHRLRLILENPEQARGMGARARRRYLTDFALSTMVDRIVEVYRAAIG